MSIQWGRIVLIAFVMEVILIAIAVPIALSGYQAALNYIIPPASFVATLATMVWLGKAIRTRPIAHGVLVGVAGSLMYVLLTRGQPEPWPYLVAHALKILGGAAGGALLARRDAQPVAAV